MKEIVKWISTEDISFYTRIWSSETVEAKCIFYLIHGSVEHAGRYRTFAEFLTRRGFVVIAPDLRGHGQTGLNYNGLGYFSDNPMGWELCVHDLKIIYDQCVTWYPNLPIIMFGHSMGSYLVRCFVKEYKVKLEGVILSGTGAFARGIGDIGIGLARLVMHLKGRQHRSPFLTRLVYDSLNRRMGSTRTGFDFLSRDIAQVDAYIQDPLCGYTCTAEYIHEMLLGTQKSNEKDVFELEPQTLPLLIISGEMDPVGDHKGKGIKKVIKHYRQNMVDVTVNLYPGARHEMLNETNKEAVFEDIEKWLNYKLQNTERKYDYEI